MDIGKGLFLCPHGHRKRPFPMSRRKSDLFICQGEKGLEFSFDNFISKFSFPIWEWNYVMPFPDQEMV